MKFFLTKANKQTKTKIPSQRERLRIENENVVANIFGFDARHQHMCLVNRNLTPVFQ